MNFLSLHDITEFIQGQPRHIQMIIMGAIGLHTLLLGLGIIFYFTSRPTKRKKRIAFLECNNGTNSDWETGYQKVFVDYIEQNLNMDCVVFNMVKGSVPAKGLLRHFHGAIVGGSVAGANDDAKWVQSLENLIKELARHSDFPILGTCFGHQIIAKALGGKVEKAKDFTLKIETVNFNSNTKELPFQIEKKRLNVLQSHGDIVTRLPKGAVSLANSATAKHEFFFRSPNILCHQGHPEISSLDAFSKILPLMKEKLPDPLATQESLRNDTPSTAAFAKIQRSFFQSFFSMNGAQARASETPL